MMGGASITGGYLEVDGTRIAYESAGAGEAVICIHTAGMDGTQWRYVLPELAAAGMRGIAVDLPAHGKSDVPRGGLISSAQDYAAFVARFAAALGERSVAVVGCSVGGDIALATAARHPDLVRATVAAECADVTKQFPSILLKMGSESAGAPGWNDMFAYNAIASVGSRIPSDRLYQLGWAHRRASRDVANQDLTAWNEFDISSELGKISCPTLVVYGLADYFVPRERVRRTVAAIRGAQLVELADVGHYPMLEEPTFGALVVDFLREGKVPAPAGARP